MILQDLGTTMAQTLMPNIGVSNNWGEQSKPPFSQLDKQTNLMSIQKGWSMMTYHHACCTLAIDYMNSTDSVGSQEKRQRLNERGREVSE